MHLFWRHSTSAKFGSRSACLEPRGAPVALAVAEHLAEPRAYSRGLGGWGLCDLLTVKLPQALRVIADVVPQSLATASLDEGRPGVSPAALPLLKAA